MDFPEEASLEENGTQCGGAELDTAGFNKMFIDDTRISSGHITDLSIGKLQTRAP